MLPLQSILKFFYSLWILSLPFYLYSLIGTLSLDNILAPLVFGLALFNVIFSAKALPSRKLTTLIIFTLFFALYACGRLLSVIDHSEYFTNTSSLMLKQLIYLTVPMLFINSRKDLVLTSRLIVVVAVIGIFSALIASVGLYEFPVERYAESRIGIDFLKKAIGLFANFGDMAMLGSYALLYLFICEWQEKNIGHNLMKYAALLLILSGYAGTQSRNMYLTLFIGILSALYFRIAVRKGKGAGIVIGILIMLSCIGTVAILSIFEVSTLASLKGFGGTSEAAATVDARLAQYSSAWKIFLENPLIGHAISILDNRMEIHNLWFGLMALGGLVSTTAVAFMFLFIFYYMLKTQSVPTINRLKIFGMAQLLCVFVAVEFYGAMTYIFLVIMGTLAMYPIILAHESRKAKHV